MRQRQGTLEDRYRIYCDCMRETGETIISFDEWLNVGHVAKLEKPALARTFRVEWLNGYGDFANDPNLTEENATLAKIKEWDLSAYAGNAWLDEFRALAEGETVNIYGPGIGEFTEHVRFTRTG